VLTRRNINSKWKIEKDGGTWALNFKGIHARGVNYLSSLVVNYFSSPFKEDS
jgi:hypothetical protein